MRTWWGPFNADMVGCKKIKSVQRNPAMHKTQCGYVDNFSPQINILCKNKRSYPQRKAKKRTKKGKKTGKIA